MFLDVYKHLVSQDIFDDTFKRCQEMALRIVSGRIDPSNEMESYIALVWPLCSYRRISPFDKKLMDMTRDQIILETFLWKYQEMTPEQRGQTVMTTEDAKSELDNIFDDWDNPPEAPPQEQWKDVAPPPSDEMEKLMSDFMKTGDFAPSEQE